MILGELVALAKRTPEIITDASYAMQPIEFVIEVGADGTFQGLLDLRDEKRRGTLLFTPTIPDPRSSGVSAGFLVDNAKYVLGLGGDNPERNAKTLAAFQAGVAAGAEATGDAALTAVARFYAQLDAGVLASIGTARGEDWTGSERLCFAYAPEDGRYVHDSPVVRAYAAAAVEEAAGTNGRCLVTGEWAPVARTHAKIKRVPAAKTSGAALVSFNARSFESHGLRQGDNAPVSAEAARAYTAALNWLLEWSPSRWHRYGVPLGDAVIVFWTREQSEAPDLLAELWNAHRPEEVRSALEAPWWGRASAVDDAAFFALTLGGNAARVVIRDWFAGTLRAVKVNVRRYFDDLAVGAVERPLPIGVLVDALKPPGREGSVPPNLASGLFLAGLRGTAIPRSALNHSLRRFALSDGNRLQDQARVGLMKATLIRQMHTRKEITVALDQNNTEVPYVLGRLFAVIERLQGAALGKVNASIRDRYFASASSRPASVFPRLLSLSVHHAAKAEGIGGYLERVKSEVVGHLPAAGLPRTLGLEDQGLFAIGYYHQREALFTKKDANGDKEAD